MNFSTAVFYINAAMSVQIYKKKKKKSDKVYYIFKMCFLPLFTAR